MHTIDDDDDDDELELDSPIAKLSVAVKVSASFPQVALLTCIPQKPISKKAAQKQPKQVMAIDDDDDDDDDVSHISTISCSLTNLCRILPQ